VNVLALRGKPAHGGNYNDIHDTVHYVSILHPFSRFAGISLYCRTLLIVSDFKLPFIGWVSQPYLSSRFVLLVESSETRSRPGVPVSEDCLPRFVPVEGPKLQ
jgi:hypothetical protein